MSYATLIDTTKCVGCRACQVSCKSWNDLKAEKTALDGKKQGLQNPTVLSANTRTLITFNEIEDKKSPGGLKYVFAKRQCMHCDEPACVSACPVTAMQKLPTGAVINDENKCMGCRYCVVACPFGVPTAEWDSLAPKIKKCDMCHSRMGEQPPAERNGQPVTTDNQEKFSRAMSVPACVAQCPVGALQFGERDAMLKEARRRMAENPGKYVDHIYGEKEAGGTAMLYLSSVPFAELGFPDVGTESYPSRSAPALAAVPPAVVGVGALLGGTYALGKRKEEVKKQEAAAKLLVKNELAATTAHHEPHHDAHHVEFAPVNKKLMTPSGKALVALMLFGAASFVARFALGLGGSTNLSNTWAWGLWIAFDLIWIAAAAGAFATAGLIYVFQRKDLYSLGRSAVLMGLLSYSFVTVTLLADLGMPWNSYWLALSAPEHSAMFEVSWCVGMYVTVLAFEFLPVPLETLGMHKALELWKKYSGVYVVFAVTLFVYLMSRSLIWTPLAFVTFSVLAYAFRPKPGEKPVPVMLAIAAVTLSTMHQSSLGSLFLLMPDKLDAFWWSPAMPLAFFLSAIAAGTSLMVLVEMWIARSLKRRIRIQQLSALARISAFALLAYEVFRLADVAIRGQLPRIFEGSGHSALFVSEIVLGGVLPLVLLFNAKARQNPLVLALATFLTTAGVIFHRLNVVAFGIELKGTMPQIAPTPYTPSIVEWGISVGLIAATIFLFGWGIRKFPVLPKEDAA